MQTRKLSIGGMSCGHCVQTLTKALSGLPGVEDVNVSLEKKSATVRFDEGMLNSERIAQAIVEVGYEVKEEEDGDSQPSETRLSSARDSPQRRTARFKVSGMSCASCANTIEKGVRALDGTVDAAVNFAAEVLTVEYAEGTLVPGAIEEKVEALGYRAQPAESGEAGELIFHVGGMHCASCVGTIERKLRSVAGIRGASVNLASETARVSYDPSLIDRAEYVTKSLAVCHRCGGPGMYTQRVIESDELVVLGATDAYEARCRRCYDESEAHQERLEIPGP